MESPRTSLTARFVIGYCLLLLTAVLALRPPAAVADDLAPKFLLQWGKEGSGPGEFHFPIGIAVSAADEILVTDHYNNRVQKFDSEGKLLAEFAVLPNPGGIAIAPAGELYISHFPAARLSKDTTPDRISVYHPNAQFVREFGKSGDGDGELSWPGGIAIAPAGQVYVADQTNRRVQVFSLDGNFLAKWGQYGIGAGEFGGNTSPRSRVGGPQFVALDRAGNVYTTEASVGRVQKFAADGKFLAMWGDNEDRAGSFGGNFTAIPSNLRGPIGICVDTHDNVWVSAVSGRIQQFTSEGKFLRGFGGPGTEPGQFLAPHGIALDRQGHLYIVDAYNQRIQKFAVP